MREMTRGSATVMAQSSLEFIIKSFRCPGTRHAAACSCVVWHGFHGPGCRPAARWCGTFTSDASEDLRRETSEHGYRRIQQSSGHSGKVGSAQRRSGNGGGRQAGGRACP
jgi:hypothetical protein